MLRLGLSGRQREVGAAWRFLLLVEVSRRIDAVTLFVGRAVRWLTLAIPVICFSYAVFRKLFPWGHNGFSELQWYLFATVYLLAAGYTLLLDQHVRVDFFWRKFDSPLKCLIDLTFLTPLVLICTYLSYQYWDFWTVSLQQRETPEDVLQGLERWPIKLALFVGFLLLGLQCLSEAIKRICCLRGEISPEQLYGSQLVAARPEGDGS